jgi:uncharacterized membrane-anchored protein
MRNRTRLILFIAAVVLQVAILAAIPAQKMGPLLHGRTILLKVLPMDPYHILSGYYADLGFEINNFGNDMSKPGQMRAPQKERTVYLTLKQGADGLWEGVRLDDALPSGLGHDEVVLRGEMQKYGRIIYGIEQFHFPESRRDEINQKLTARNADIRAEVRVDKSGCPALVALHINGQVYR